MSRLGLAANRRKTRAATSSELSNICHDIFEGDIFGGFGVIDPFERAHLPHVSIEVVDPSDLLVLRSEDLKHLMEEDAQTAAKVISLLKGTA